MNSRINLRISNKANVATRFFFNCSCKDLEILSIETAIGIVWDFSPSNKEDNTKNLTKTASTRSGRQTHTHVCISTSCCREPVPPLLLSLSQIHTRQASSRVSAQGSPSVVISDIVSLFSSETVLIQFWTDYQISVVPFVALSHTKANPPIRAVVKVRLPNWKVGELVWQPD